jgi:hypothetical protein
VALGKEEREWGFHTHSIFSVTYPFFFSEKQALFTFRNIFLSLFFVLLCNSIIHKICFLLYVHIFIQFKFSF